MKKPAIVEGLPENTRVGVALFWAKYWAYFLFFLPWMLLRQVWVGGRQVLKNLWTWNRAVPLLGGRLIVRFVDRPSLLFVSAVFGERLTAFRFDDVIVDPGPPFSGEGILKGLLPEQLSPPKAVLVTHYHEEHLGNAPAVARRLKVPLVASRRSLRELQGPEELSVGREFFMGAPTKGEGLKTALAKPTMKWGSTQLKTLATPGHCDGHISFFEPELGLLFAGDSFLNEVFTSPNGDVDSFTWLKTLKAYLKLPIKTIVNSHGELLTRDPAFGRSWGVVLHEDPKELIQSKVDFIEWAIARVAAGEARGLSYSVIEATLFPWDRPWTWKNWFNDESFRLFTWGEFSRTHLVRSLSRHPEAVPTRFSFLDRCMKWLGLYEKQAVKELLALHMVAFRPRFVLGILAGLVASFSPLYWFPFCSDCQVFPKRPPIEFLEGPLLIWWAWLTIVWGTWGAAVTRQMALTVEGQKESLAQSMMKCVKPSLLYPGALASLCLIGIAWWPQAFLLVAPMWLVAGFIYGVLCLRQCSLEMGLQLAGRCLSKWRFWVPLQIRFLLGFGFTTGLVWAVLGSTAYVLWRTLSPLSSTWAMALSFPIAAYGLAYTTSNLKMLQVYLSKLTLERLSGA